MKNGIFHVGAVNHYISTGVAIVVVYFMTK